VFRGIVVAQGLLFLHNWRRGIFCHGIVQRSGCIQEAQPYEFSSCAYHWSPISSSGQGIRAIKNISKMNNDQYTDEQNEHTTYSRQAITRVCPCTYQGDDHYQSESGEYIDTCIHHKNEYKNPQDDDECDKEDGIL
jgi:hypothetical protein